MAVTSNTEKGENIVAFTWTVESLKEHFTKVFTESDRRYEERFIAQEKAVNTAFVASEKAVNTALIAQEKAINSALIAAKEAVLKAESATEKRFEAVNEFRQTLSDQTATFIPRAEAIQRAEQNAEKITALDKRMTDALSDINSRLDRTAGKSSGVDAFWGYLVGAVGLLAAVISIIFVLNNR